MRRLAQEDRVPRIRMRTSIWGVNRRQKAAAQEALSRHWRRGLAGLGVGMALASTAGGSGGGSTSLCPALTSSLFPPREVFEPTVERGELVVRYRVRKSYSRRTTEATCK